MCSPTLRGKSLAHLANSPSAAACSPSREPPEPRGPRGLPASGRCRPRRRTHAPDYVPRGRRVFSRETGRRGPAHPPRRYPHCALSVACSTARSLTKNAAAFTFTNSASGPARARSSAAGKSLCRTCATAAPTLSPSPPCLATASAAAPAKCRPTPRSRLKSSASASSAAPHPPRPLLPLPDNRSTRHAQRLPVVLGAQREDKGPGHLRPRLGLDVFHRTFAPRLP